MPDVSMQSVDISMHVHDLIERLGQGFRGVIYGVARGSSIHPLAV